MHVWDCKCQGRNQDPQSSVTESLEFKFPKSPLLRKQKSTLIHRTKCTSTNDLDHSDVLKKNQINHRNVYWHEAQQVDRKPVRISNGTTHQRTDTSSFCVCCKGVSLETTKDANENERIELRTHRIFSLLLFYHICLSFDSLTTRSALGLDPRVFRQGDYNYLM